MYFHALGGDASAAIYRSNGTNPGTVEVLDKLNGPPFGGSILGVSNDLLYNTNGKINVYNGATSVEILAKNQGGLLPKDVGGIFYFEARIDDLNMAAIDLLRAERLSVDARI